MESRLPKPSALKKPMPIAKSILPMDRIKPSVPSGFVHKAQICTSLHSLNTGQPLSRDLSNIHEYAVKRGRAASPETQRPQTYTSRTKLRRSRSACDISDMRSIKQIDSTLVSIALKTTREKAFTTSGTFTNGTNKAPRHGVENMSIIQQYNPLNRVSSAQSTRITVGRTTTITSQTSAGKKPSATVISSASATSARKPAGKRIPPYDFKARYKDLVEKHNVLKKKLEEKLELLLNLENIPEQLTETQSQLIATQQELKNTHNLNECLQRQSKLHQEKLEELERLTKIYSELKAEHSKLSTEVLELRERTFTLTEQNQLLAEEVGVYKEQLFLSNMERKELHNTVMDLRGNIRVFCRVRPTLDCELDKVLCGWNYLDESTVEIVNAAARNKTSAHSFTFDQVFHPASNQEAIFEMVSPLIQSALDGYNICIFAYGQTGSGKTYTMDGISSNPGVIPRTVDLLFESIKNYRNLGWEYEIKGTFLEIYNEVLYDLLSNEQKDMEIRMVKNSKNDIYVSNITQETVESADQLRQLMNIAKMNRATAATVGNDRSSRSHAVTKIELIGTHDAKKERSIGSINLVDLAGSESPKTSIRMNETKNINRSLSELTNVILALLQKQDHIPYRNSKLTHLLMPSLGGNSKTLMFINVAPLQECFGESLKSLRFAASVNQCRMAKAKRIRIHNSSLVNTSGVSN